MNKSDIISRVALRADCKEAVVKKAVNVTLKLIKDAIAAHGRVEMRGFGAFSVKTYEGNRYVRNPATGVAEYVKRLPRARFKAGKGLRKEVDGQNGI
jgi:integration host factor subunit beta